MKKTKKRNETKICKSVLKVAVTCVLICISKSQTANLKVALELHTNVTTGGRPHNAIGNRWTYFSTS